MIRDKLIQTIQRNKPTFISLPENIKFNEQKYYPDLKETFQENLKKVGGEIINSNRDRSRAQYIGKHYPGALDFGSGTDELWKEYSPSCMKEKLELLDTVILNGQFGVAENGAIWLDDDNFPNRLVPFIAQRLIIRLDSSQIVRDMIEAYAKINLKNTGYGVFISGPSKTADIEQSLVYGAHGAKKVIVIIY